MDTADYMSVINAPYATAQRMAQYRWMVHGTTRAPTGFWMASVPDCWRPADPLYWGEPPQEARRQVWARMARAEWQERQRRKSGPAYSRAERLRVARLRHVRYDPSAVRTRLLPPGAVCLYCGDLAEEIDHIVAVTWGGTSDPTNLAPTCYPYNREKSDLLLSESEWRPERVVRIAARLIADADSATLSEAG